jgi:Family of unknown function (DUF6152)
MTLTRTLAAAAFVLVSAPSLAHHSFAMFDNEKTVTISGTVKEFEWSNPHAWIHVVAEEAGRQVEWSFEMGSVGQIAAQGWKRDSIKPGDKISVSGHPLRDGSRGGQYRSATLANGTTISQRPDGNNNNLPGR